MLTPAIRESSTSSPLTIRCQASSTQVRGPPFRYSCPLLDEMTTGGVARRTRTVGRLAARGGRDRGGDGRGRPGLHEVTASDGVGH